MMAAGWLALDTIRVQERKRLVTLSRVMIGVMFLIAVVSIAGGMSKYAKIVSPES